MLLMDKSIKPGDVISVDDTYGWVNSLGGRYVSVVTRDGTDYGQDEMSMQQKAAHLLAELKTGELLITYNEDTQTCGLVTKEDLRE